MRILIFAVAIPAIFACAMSPVQGRQEEDGKKTRDLEERLNSQQEEIDKLREDVRQLKGAQALAQPFKLQIFGGMTAAFDNQDRSDNAFALGEVDFFAQEDLGKGFSSLAEFVLEGNDAADDWEADLERISLTYHHSDALIFTAGKYHCPRGYWNDQYHHGEYLFPTVQRPHMSSFEDDDGFIPGHCVGVNVSGRPAVLRGFSYDLFISNGRGGDRSEVQNFKDNNNAKAIGVGLSYGGFDLFTLGASIARDKVDADIRGVGDFEFQEIISSAYVQHEAGHFAMVVEAFLIDHDKFDYEERRQSRGGYLLMTYEISSFTPYLLMERSDMAGADAYWSDLRDRNEGRIGVRWDFHSNAALKVEYDHTVLKDDENPMTDDRYGTLLMNVSFYF